MHSIRAAFIYSEKLEFFAVYGWNESANWSGFQDLSPFAGTSCKQPDQPKSCTCGRFEVCAGTAKNSSFSLYLKNADWTVI
jgi:hypothetical protein